MIDGRPWKVNARAAPCKYVCTLMDVPSARWLLQASTKDFAFSVSLISTLHDSPRIHVIRPSIFMAFTHAEKLFFALADL